MLGFGCVWGQDLAFRYRVWIGGDCQQTSKLKLSVNACRADLDLATLDVERAASSPVRRLCVVAPVDFGGSDDSTCPATSPSECTCCRCQSIRTLFALG